MYFTQINAAWSILERIKLIKPKKEDSVASRFIRLCESHGVHRNQIPRVFGHNLTVADVASADALLSRLSEEILEDACKRFAVRREWLDGASSEIYPIHHFSKDFDEFTDFITQLTSENPDSYIRVILIKPDEKSYGQPALLLFEEKIGNTADNSYYRYHLSNEWIYSSGMVRGYLTAYIAKCLLYRRLHVFGISAPSKLIKSISDGQTMLGWNGKGAIEGIKGRKWYPEDMALSPEDFLDGVNPETDKFGVIEGLSIWLKLESQGHMKLGLNIERERNARQLFEQELKKYSA
ncbi:MAG: hypothetical protein ACL93V_12915 [Candidatus Electrothrix sp. YB6]